jgi:hypothetical protein
MYGQKNKTYYGCGWDESTRAGILNFKATNLGLIYENGQVYKINYSLNLGTKESRYHNLIAILVEIRGSTANKPYRYENPHEPDPHPPEGSF